jgi:predicted GTPase
MSRWRVLVVLVLLAVPFLVLAGLGSYYLWRESLWLYVWWPMAASVMAGYLLGWHWQRKKQLLQPTDTPPPLHWTERDKLAWQLVEARAKAAAKLDSIKFTEFNFYTETGQQMALEMARFYHPGAADPIASLTIPEILAVVELASQDLAKLVDECVPGSQILTIKNLRQARQAVDWYQTASSVYWMVSALFSPVDTAVRYAASNLGLTRPLAMLQQNLLLWFYTAYIHRLGSYLIDLNSGRLRVGAKRYRELLQRAGGFTPADGKATADSMPSQPAASEPGAAVSSDDTVRRVTLTLLGQVKVGKSSLVNALLGEQRAHTDVLPATGEVTRYELQPEGIPTRLVLLDTVGYAHTGPKEDQLRVTQEAAQQSDLLLLVVHARNPARQADLAMLQGLRAWFAARPDLRMPPIVAVVSHIDLLSPALEWSPPYDWQNPQRTKEKQIAAALDAVREQLGEHLKVIVPVCTTPGKVFGIEEGLLPAVADLLDEGQAVGLLRCIRAEINAEKVRKVFRQLKGAARVLWQNLTVAVVGGRETASK